MSVHSTISIRKIRVIKRIYLVNHYSELYHLTTTDRARRGAQEGIIQSFVATAIAPTLFRNLRRQFLVCRERDTVTYSPSTLLTMVHEQTFSIITRQSPSRGFSLSDTWGRTEQLCAFEPSEPSLVVTNVPCNDIHIR